MSKPDFKSGHSILNNQDYKYLSTGKDGLELSVTYHNFTGKNVSVINRHGIRFLVRPAPTLKTGNFTIRYKYLIPRSSYIDIQKMLVQMDINPEHNPELAAFEEGCLRQINNNTGHQNIPTSIDTTISIDDLMENDVYVTGSDVILTLKSLDIKVQHPFSGDVLNDQRYGYLLEIGNANNNSGVGFFIDIVDNTSQIGPRYVLNADQISRISPKQNTTRESGIYRIYINDKQEVIVDRFDLDKCNELGLYRTREEALASGDRATLLKNQMAEATQKHQIMLQELQRESAEANRKFEAEILAIKSANLKIENDNKDKDKLIEELKLKREQDKNAFEMQQITLKSEYEAAKIRDQRESDKTKMLGEVLKFSVLVISSAVSLLAIISKITNKKE